MAQGQMEPSQLGHFGKRWRSRGASKAVSLWQCILIWRTLKHRSSRMRHRAKTAQGEGRPDRAVLPLAR